MDCDARADLNPSPLFPSIIDLGAGANAGPFSLGRQRQNEGCPQPRELYSRPRSCAGHSEAWTPLNPLHAAPALPDEAGA